VAADAGLTVVAEAFADRAYRADGTLVPRGQPGAVITDPARVAARAASMATSHTVESLDGHEVPAPFRSVCVHGDTPGAVTLARAVREALERAGLHVAPFA
jgi:5-oxoprolinase (ATP-hydrolysing) subunit A